jgi:hypothetical protein
MKKLTVWALLAMFVVAGAAFAAPAKVAPNASVFIGGGPATTDNDNSCDIGTYPAATLLLPYFEVSSDADSENTLFTITNVSAASAIAHVVLWTDYSFPVIDFNIYLTPYDVQSISLHDIIWRGEIAPETDAKNLGTGTEVSPGDNVDNPDGNGIDGLDSTACESLPGTVPPFYQERMQEAFTLGTVDAVQGFPGSDCDTVGNEHDNAVGYATIDVADICGTGLPTDGDDYFTNEIRFDNVLIGDYQQVDSSNDFAQGNPMVHIRAVPDEPQDTISDAGDPGTNFDYTFYSRYQDLGAGDEPGVLDRRQPLPSLFAARWIQGGPGTFNTSFKIWREGTTGAGAECGDYPDNGEIIVPETVIFDEDENGVGHVGGEVIISPSTGVEDITLPETSLVSVADANTFPHFGDATSDGQVAGWVYFNLDNGTDEAVTDDNSIASQNWVVVSMRAENRYSVDFDAASLGNGCTPPAAISTFTDGNGVIGPASNDTGCVWNCP